MKKLFSHTGKSVVAWPFCFLFLSFLTGCSPQQPKKQSVAQIGSHRIKVIPGCQTEETIGLRNEGVQPAYQFTCLGTDAVRVVIVQDKELRINGVSFGTLKEDDEVVIKNGEILVDGRKAGTLSDKAAN